MALSCAMDGGDPAVADLVAGSGAEEAWRQIREGALGEPVAQRAAQVASSVIARLATACRAPVRRPRGRGVAGGAGRSEAMPSRSSGAVACRSACGCAGPAIWRTLMQRSVAIVGSRAATAYGNGVTTDLAADLAERGVTVVSGGAFGIDAAAHRGALAAGGPTVGVLACGVDVAYPPANAPLFDTARPRPPAGLRARRRARTRPGSGSWPGTG